MCELRLGHHMTSHWVTHTHTVRANLVSLVSLTLLRGLQTRNAGAVMIASTHVFIQMQNHIKMNTFAQSITLSIKQTHLPI